MNVQHKTAILIGYALCWMFIGSAVLCYAYAGYVILYAIALSVNSKWIGQSQLRIALRFFLWLVNSFTVYVLRRGSNGDS